MNTVVKLDTERELRYDFRAFVAMDEDCGINPMDPKTYADFSPRKIQALVWAGQLHTKNPLTKERVLEFLPTDGAALVRVMESVSEALARALEAPKE